MVAMMRRPPENALLGGRHGHPGNHKLKPATGFEGAMRKIAMIAGGDEEHAHFKKHESGDEIRPLKRQEKDAQRSNVDKSEGNQGNQVETRPIGERERQRTCNRGHAPLLLPGNAREGGSGPQYATNVTAKNNTSI